MTMVSLVAALPSTVLFLCVLWIPLAQSFKYCFNEDRLRIWDDPCTTAWVPRTLKKRNSLLASSQSNEEGTCRVEELDADGVCSASSEVLEEHDDVCSYVTRAIFAEKLAYDAVLLHQGMCMTDIPAGSFSPEDALRLLPHNEEMVSLLIEGKNLVRAIRGGIQFAYSKNVYGSFPTTAGMRYKYQIIQDTVEVYDAEIMNGYCGWDAIQPDTMYRVLTNRYLSQGNAGYLGLHDALASKGTGRTGVDIFLVSYSSVVCGGNRKRQAASQRDNKCGR